MHEQSFAIPVEEKLQDGRAELQVQVEGAVDKLELPATAVEQLLHFGEECFEWRVAHRRVERRETELTFKRTPARRLDIDDPMRDVFIGVQRVGQGDGL